MHQHRIVQLTTVHPRGDTRIFYREVRSLSRLNGAALTLVLADGQGSEPHSVGGAEVSVRDLGKPPGGRVGRAVIGSWRVIVAMRAVKADVVHFHDPELIPAGIVLKMLGYRVVYDVHEDVPRQIFNKYWIPRVLRRSAAWTMSALEWLAGRSFDAVVAATPLIAKRFPYGKSIVVQNFPVLAELKFDNGKPYYERRNQFVYVGALSRVRGVCEMIRAIGSIESDAEATLDLAGRFQPDSLKADVQSLHGWESVTYHGWATRAEVARLLGCAKAGLVVLHPMPNYLEAYAVKMFEYMAAGLPIIASDFPLWREIIDRAGCGLLVNPLNPQDIADAMRWIMENPSRAFEMGRRGERAVRECYSWETESTKLLALYDKLLKA